MNKAKTSLDEIALIPLRKRENASYDEIAILINGRSPTPAAEAGGTR